MARARGRPIYSRGNRDFAFAYRTWRLDHSLAPCGLGTARRAPCLAIQRRRQRMGGDRSGRAAEPSRWRVRLARLRSDDGFTPTPDATDLQRRLDAAPAVEGGGRRNDGSAARTVRSPDAHCTAPIEGGEESADVSDR